MTTRKRLSVAAPWTILAALLLVGIVSGTILRHTIQAPPALVAGPVIAARAPWSRFAAMPIFVFWLLIMFLIRVYLPGVARVLTGHFTLAEVNLTIAFLLFAAFQVCAAWLGRQPGIGRR